MTSYPNSGIPRKRLRVGVVGTGYLGRFHARVYAEMADVDLVGVVDINEATAQEIAGKCGCPAYTDLASLIDKIDAVSIVVPTSNHLEVARPFLERHIDMLMEKPLAPDYKESLEIVELAEQAGVIFQVGHLERFNPGVMALAEQCDNPRFIEVHRLGTFAGRAADVDVVTDLMIHDIDIVMSLVKSPLSGVAANGAPVITDHVDIANARLEFENGAVANVTASRVSNKKLRRIRVFGGRRYYGLDYIDQRLEIARIASTDEQWPQITTETMEITPRPPLDTELQSFVDCVRDRTAPLVDGRTSLEALRVALMVKEKISACLT